MPKKSTAGRVAAKKKKRPARQKIPSVRRTSTVKERHKKQVRSLPEANEKRRHMPGMFKENWKDFENKASRLYAHFVSERRIVEALPEFFKWRYEQEEAKGWVHTAEKTPLGSPKESFKDHMLLWYAERFPDLFNRQKMAKRNLEMSQEYLQMSLAVIKECEEDPAASLRKNVALFVESMLKNHCDEDFENVPIEPYYERPPLVIEAEMETDDSPPPSSSSSSPPLEQDDDVESLEDEDFMDNDEAEYTKKEFQALPPYEVLRYANKYARDSAVIGRVKKYITREQLHVCRQARCNFLTDQDKRVNLEPVMIYGLHEMHAKDMVEALQMLGPQSWEANVESLPLYKQDELLTFINATE